LANKYQEDFLDRVLAFAVSIESAEAITWTVKAGEQCICVEFFEEKEWKLTTELIITKDKIYTWTKKKYSDGGLKNMTINSILRLNMEALLP
jgi:hypothetical protein